MVRLLSAAAAVLLLASCSDDTCPPREIPAEASQTLVMYLAGTDLRPYFEENVRAAARAVARGALGREGRLMVFIQSREDSFGLELYRDPCDGECTIDTLRRYGRVVSTDPAEVTRILDDLTAEAPARAYGLVLGSHGMGWIPSPVPAAAATGADRRREAIWQKPAGESLTRWFGVDRGRYIETSELAAAIEAVPVRFDYILFDACFMASVEALYDLRRTVPYVVASPCEVMNTGFPYERVVPALFADADTETRLTRACEEFHAFYRDYSTPSGCVSLCRTDRLAAVAEALRALNASPRREVDPSALQTYEGMTSHQFHDLQDYVRLAFEERPLAERFDEALAAAFPVRYHTDAFYSDYNRRMNPVLRFSGVTTYLPATAYLAQWRRTAWALATESR